MISPSALTEFKEILNKDYGVSITSFEASRLAENFLIALEAILKNEVDKEPRKEQK